MKILREILFIPAFLLAGNCFSQQVIATAGSSGSGTGIELSWTIGEPVTSTTFGSGFILTQGFHQGQPATESQSQQINVSQGWNIVSMNVIPANTDLMNVFQTLIDNKSLKKVMDETGLTIEDWGIYGGWQNDIGPMATTEGYKINANSATTFSVEGTTLLFPFKILLNAGWNIISWPAYNEQDGMTVFQSLIDDGKLNKVMDEAGATIEDWGIFGGWQNDIGNLKPGEGYKVNVSSDCFLTVNASGVKSDKIKLQQQISTHFVPVFTGNGTDHMNINLVNLTESGIRENDEIGIFDGQLCVGTALVGYKNINENKIGIPVSANDGLHAVSGFTDGNTITTRLFRNSTEQTLTIVPAGDQPIVFEKGSSLFATLKSDLNTFDENISLYNSIKCYPNPFNDKINIDINLIKDSEVSAEVLNQVGQSVKYVTSKQLRNAGLHKFSWDGRNDNYSTVSPGIYHLRVTINEHVFHKKLAYSK